MSAALQAVLRTIDAEIARLQQAREVVAGLTGSAVVVPPSKQAVTEVEEDDAAEVDELTEAERARARAQRTRAALPVRNRDSDKHTAYTRKPNITLTPEQIAALRKTWMETENISKAAEAAGVSFYVAKKRITTMQIEGQL